MLNASKGPAVWALRAQTDKLEYAAGMRRVLEATPNLAIREGALRCAALCCAMLAPLLACGCPTHPSLLADSQHSSGGTL